MSSEDFKTAHTIESIRNGFILNLAGIFKISQLFSNPLKPPIFRICLGVFISFVSIVLLFEVPLFEIIVEIKALIISIIPNILGFTIGGYSFLIGFIQPTLMNKISEPTKDSAFSFFQVSSAAFACNIVLQSFALFLGFLVHFFIFIDSKKLIFVKLPSPVIYFSNLLCFLVLSLALIFALGIIVQLVVNVFNFSQLHHYNINMEKLKQKQPKSLN